MHRQTLSLKGWVRHVLGVHPSEHGPFEVEVLYAEEGRVQIVLLSHQHPFYEPNTPEDADRRAYHEGVIIRDLAGQKEYSWGEVLCRLERACNKDWLVIAYRRNADIPLPANEVVLRLFAQVKLPEGGT